MSRTAKPVSVSRLNDLIFGSFSLLPPSETIDHLVRYLSTWSGSDKFFMIIQYAVKIIIPLLNLRARLQYRAGLRKHASSSAATRYAKIGSIVGDSRVLWRIWGILPIIQWLVALERNHPPTRKLLTIERLQGFSMLAYYPLEHLYYLVSHGIVPSTLPSLGSVLSLSGKPITISTNALGIWSCRFWALYVLLQFAHLREDRVLLQQREKTLRKAKGTAPLGDERRLLDQRWDSFWNEVVVNLGYLPLTVHWSLEKGIFKNEAWVGVFGLIAAVGSFRSGWKATAISSPPAVLPEAEPVDPPTTGSDASS